MKIPFMESGDIILTKELSAARGIDKAELVLKNANIVNVFTETVNRGDIAVTDGLIVGIGEYHGVTEIDCTGKYAVPGFIDGHIHLESSMLKPVEFAKAVLPHGTTAVITDPHEIANVCGTDGIRYMMEASKGLPLDVYFALPSCVPSTPFDENGERLSAKDLEYFYQQERVVGLAEVMDYIGTVCGDCDIHDKINYARQHNKAVDGHAPGLHGKEVCAYILSGVGSDHECVSFDEAKEKLSLGQWIMIREGTAAKNLDALLGLFKPPYHQRSMLVTDDKHPHDLLQYGHMDEIIRTAVKKGADPCIAIKMATYNTAVYFGLKNLGAIAPGYRADIVLLSDLKGIKIEKVIKNGSVTVGDNKQGELASQFTCPVLDQIAEPVVDDELLKRVHNSFFVGKLVPKDFELPIQPKNGGQGYLRVIQLVKGEIVTKEVRVPLCGGLPKGSEYDGILKAACIERHHNTGHIGIGFVKGYGLKKGAIASSVAHDSHNIIVIGTNDDDMAAAANTVIEMQGGWAIASEGKMVAKLPLPIGGLISELDAASLSEQINRMKMIAGELGVSEGIDPFMTLAFVSLPVIPELRLITSGLFDVGRQRIVPVILESEESGE